MWTLNFEYFPNIQPSSSLLNVVNDDEYEDDDSDDEYEDDASDDEYEDDDSDDEKLLFGQLGVACNGLIMKMIVLRMMIRMMMVMTTLMIMMAMTIMMMMMMIKSSCWSSHAMAFSHTLL